MRGGTLIARAGSCSFRRSAGWRRELTAACLFCSKDSRIYVGLRRAASRRIRLFVWRSRPRRSSAELATIKALKSSVAIPQERKVYNCDVGGGRPGTSGAIARLPTLCAGQTAARACRSRWGVVISANTLHFPAPDGSTSGCRTKGADYLRQSKSTSTCKPSSTNFWTRFLFAH